MPPGQIFRDLRRIPAAKFLSLSNSGMTGETAVWPEIVTRLLRLMWYRNDTVRVRGQPGLLPGRFHIGPRRQGAAGRAAS